MRQSVICILPCHAFFMFLIFMLTQDVDLTLDLNTLCPGTRRKISLMVVCIIVTKVLSRLVLPSAYRYRSSETNKQEKGI